MQTYHAADSVIAALGFSLALIRYQQCLAVLWPIQLVVYA